MEKTDLKEPLLPSAEVDIELEPRRMSGSGSVSSSTITNQPNRLGYGAPSATVFMPEFGNAKVRIVAILKFFPFANNFFSRRICLFCLQKETRPRSEAIPSSSHMISLRDSHLLFRLFSIMGLGPLPSGATRVRKFLHPALMVPVVAWSFIGMYTK